MTASPLPPISGREADLLRLVQAPGPSSPPPPNRRLGDIQSCFACALHMHQPTIPAGAEGELISHLQFMVDHPDEGDNHNAAAFADCYRRMAEIIPELIAAGHHPRIMLDYSGTLLWGLEQMGRSDILDALRSLTCDPQCQDHVEWLGTFWGHAVAPSTPIPDLRLQIQAWQHQFAALFGDQALQRVRGFSLPEMHLPNHPDTLHALVGALKDCGYRWLMVQEHSVETLDGSPLPQSQKYSPNRLLARSSSGAEASILALIKTQGSDTKLVGQMQPCYEALGLSRQLLGDITIPAIVCQIADGENGGVMMNEFPGSFQQAYQRLASEPGDGPATVAINGSEYLALLEAGGIDPAAYPVIQAVQQHTLWSRAGDPPNPESVAAAIRELKAAGGSFSMDGASWTNSISWVSGYENVLEPMQALSARFHELFDPWLVEDPSLTSTPHYQDALLHLLLLQTSCFRYWGQGTWTDHAREIHRRGLAALERAQQVRELVPAS
ncbi:glycosyl hydrolase family 57 [Synechococcus sp. RSCCF101]|uniref:glycosyl hydrolase family 57 n=1 Tax=Synechococcus sp. RSCCF101 TaxID=2511069 RepID=UPI001247E5DD|nr:glycosyl hydrolase family 57 [Synechococcus sp. RSCCF101]QEY32692.1 glycosyl hydrolase family 57 [Synechococcus sp. RSCCF101]